MTRFSQFISIPIYKPVQYKLKRNNDLAATINYVNHKKYMELLNKKKPSKLRTNCH